MDKITFNQGETPNIAIDIETLSTRSTAAIISIAAKVFSLSGDSKEIEPSFYQIISASTCAMEGLHFDMDTINWWKRQDEDAKVPHQGCSDSVSIIEILDRLRIFINDVRKHSPTGKVLIWSQGSDFDIPILRHAFAEVLGYDTPWKHDEVRDSRTFILAILGITNPETTNGTYPYSLIPKREGWKQHDAMSDVEQLIWNVRWVYQHAASLMSKETNR